MTREELSGLQAITESFGDSLRDAISECGIDLDEFGYNIVVIGKKDGQVNAAGVFGGPADSELTEICRNVQDPINEAVKSLRAKLEEE